jgi:hypothetical protein
VSVIFTAPVTHQDQGWEVRKIIAEQRDPVKNLVVEQLFSVFFTPLSVLTDPENYWCHTVSKYLFYKSHGY